MTALARAGAEYARSGPLARALLADLGLIGPIGRDAPNLLRTAIVLGLSAGLCEGLLRLLTFWWLNRRGLVEHWSGAVMVGLGHGLSLIHI